MSKGLNDLANQWDESENGRYGLDENNNEIAVLNGHDCAKDLRAALPAVEAEMRELGPCGKHPKMFTKTRMAGDGFPNDMSDPEETINWCTLCEEIRLAVEKALQSLMDIADNLGDPYKLFGALKDALAEAGRSSSNIARPPAGDTKPGE